MLGGGARFDKKRFKEDIEVFQPKAVSTGLNADTEAALATELDFFKNKKSVVKKAPAKKAEKKKTQSESASEDEDDSGESSGEDQTHEGDESEDEDGDKSESDDDEDQEDQEDESIGFEDKEQLALFRSHLKIRVYGTDIPNPFRSFDGMAKQYQLDPYLQRNILSSGFKQPTPIQMQAIPVFLHGRDLMAMAPTGSGKTMAFVLPILHDLKGPEKVGYRAVIISPTRELATQIFNQIKKLSVGRKFKICMLTKATAATQGQAPHLRQKYDILISTPLRLVHAIQQEKMELDHVRHLVLDEADKLLEQGFLEQTDEIFAACSHPSLQKSLFSATLPSGVEALANTFMRSPIRIVIGSKNAATETITQKLIYCGSEEGKLIAIRQQIQKGLKPPVLIFVQSIERAKELFHELIYDGINVDVIHSERTKAQRDKIVEGFRQGKVWVLIATELMARGVDFKGVNLVINYDFPQTVQSYIHRIGRTGRAGRSGEAITYFTNEDQTYLKSIVNVMRESGCEVADWMLAMKKPSKNQKKNLRQMPLGRSSINTMSSYDKKKIAHKRDMIANSKKRKANGATPTANGGHKKSKGDNSSA
ncbi:P-loop containing nucleoside triphosphate hydrolase protein [Gamsiella multidivaricata]|uniref:P-loop containing nucleoside triphosphate hydrolase protein n=1 Tax=Gamsiella multidivaricata TaxID=101098 RepID=UPI00221E6F56|nr:P-loop containing nucleoside triphosphate hydrolase protein [Gamsiella multidivaricata]KAI7831411.1 P-loop containing nucleoside triphosphate hydrolase protein [Gamsiella multidivaricata]